MTEQVSIEAVVIQSVTYRTIHNWVIRHYGKASKCESNTCKGKSMKYEWALKKGYSYAKEIENFIQLCASCHRKYDASDHGKTIGRDNLNKGRISRRRRVLQIGMDGTIVCEHESILAAARAINRSDATIHGVLAGRIQSAGGFAWKYA